MPPSPLVSAHITAEARLRQFATEAVRRIWGGLPGYDRSDQRLFVNAAVPIVAAAQRQSIAVTDAYIAQRLGRKPMGVSPERILRKTRNGVSLKEVYQRPFVNVWSDLKDGKPWEDAVASGVARAASSAAMDVQLAARGTFADAQEADDGIYGYERVADGAACEFCQMVDGAYVKSGDAMALHNNCGCSLEPLTAPHPRAASLPSGVAVREHGELGAMLGSPDHNFTSEAQL